MKNETTSKKVQLSPEALEARRAYRREWARKNPERVAAYERNRWERAAERMKVQRAEGDGE